MENHEINRTLRMEERQILRDNGIINLEGDIENIEASITWEDLMILSLNPNIQNINLSISSNGGEITAMTSIVRSIRVSQSKGKRIIGHVFGHAMSAAFIVLQCCDERTMGRLCTLMAHGFTTFQSGDMRDVEAERKLLKYWQREVASLISARCTAKDSKYATFNFWNNLMESNTPLYFNSEEALKFGLIDKVDEL